MDTRDLTKLLRTGLVSITTTGITINDEVRACYTVVSEKGTYIVIKFSNGHVVAPVENIKKVDVEERSYNLFDWQYDIFNSDNEFLCSIIKVRCVDND